MKFEDIIPEYSLRFSPLEMVKYDAFDNSLIVEFDCTDAVRRRLVFKSVLEVRLFIEDKSKAEYRVRSLGRSVFECIESEYVVKLIDRMKMADEPIPPQLRHFLFPVEDGIWEWLAYGWSIA